MNGTNRGMFYGFLMIFSIAAGLFVGAVSFALPAAGHGWIAAFLGMSAVIMVPLGAVAWINRDTENGTIAAVVAVTVNTVVDVAVVIGTSSNPHELSAFRQFWYTDRSTILAWVDDLGGSAAHPDTCADRPT